MSSAIIQDSGVGNKSKLKHKVCPDCGAQALVHKRHFWRVLVGLFVTLICGLLAVPTLGVSVVFMIWGVMQTLKVDTCKECGWSEHKG